MDKQKLKRMVRGALLAAIVAAMTMLIKLPVPATGGYVHPGDGAIFLAAYLMGPWAAIPAAAGWWASMVPISPLRACARRLTRSRAGRS